MTRIKPLTMDELPAETQAALEFSQSLMGYVPNSVMTMAHWHCSERFAHWYR